MCGILFKKCHNWLAVAPEKQKEIYMTGPPLVCRLKRVP